jgi:hypothetical protein
VYKITANASIPEHAWDKYDWGSGPSFLIGFIKVRSRSMGLAWFLTAM